MTNSDVLILPGDDVHALLEGRELELVRTVQQAYTAHAAADSALPHSTFLRFPDEQRNRIIALPAYIGQEFGVAGIKWIASFPGNHERGLDRASAVVILNSAVTGRPEAIIEGSIISAKRTAASAALAARAIHRAGNLTQVGLIGCGLINFEIARFLQALFPNPKTFVIYDVQPERAAAFKRTLEELAEGIDVVVVRSINAVLSTTSLIAIATTAVDPHIDDLSVCAPASTILHVSLRDLAPEVIFTCDNIVDDADHVCRADTSIHLAEQRAGNRDFIRCTLAEILRGAAPARKDSASIAVFSPFGLGVLDIAVGKLVRDLALDQGRGTIIPSFLPSSWTRRSRDTTVS